MRYKIQLNIIRFLISILFVLYIIVFCFLLNGYMEKGVVDKQLEEFKERGVFEQSTIIQGQNVNIYYIEKKYDFEDNTHIVFDSSVTSKYYIGSKTDIVLTTRNPLRMSGDAIVKDIGGYISKNFFAGHATINITEDGSQCIESVGNDTGFNGVRQVDNDWIFTEVRS